MSSIFAQVVNTEDNGIPESPVELFRGLPNKSIPYLRDVQSDVLEKWFLNREKSDTLIKMNTGTGKTLIGLITLKFSLLEGMNKAMYLLPNKHLVKQAIKEAEALGIDVTDTVNSASFLEKKSILITTVQTLFNSKSQFGINHSEIDVDAIIIDDAHACFEIASSQYSAKINCDCEVYEQIRDCLIPSLQSYKPIEVEKVLRKDNTALLRTPFWMIRDNREELIKTLLEYKDREELKFSVDFLIQSFDLCEFVFSGEDLSIFPKHVNLNLMPTFANAKRKIYMTATFSDELTLINEFGISENLYIISPDYLGDIGDRFIILPQYNDSIQFSEDFVFEYAKHFSDKYNILVIVSSNIRAEEWTTKTNATFHDRKNIHEIPKGNSGISVVANKYDGLDLPGDDCRIVIIDGIPKYRSAKEKIEADLMRGCPSFNKKTSYKIEQGIGRGIRSNDDYCAVMVWEDKLYKFYSATEHFSKVTDTQLNLSNRFTKEIPNEHGFYDATEHFLARDESWVRKSKQEVSKLKALDEYSDRNDEWREHEKNAYKSVIHGNLDKAIIQQQQAVDLITELSDSGKIPHQHVGASLEQLSRIYYLIGDKETSIKILNSAQQLNTSVAKSWVKGPQVKNIDQPEKVISLQPKPKQKLLKNIEKNLVFDDAVSSNNFELSLEGLGLLLGFNSSRPEKDKSYQSKLDVLWEADGRYLLLPCKHQVENSQICKSDGDKTLSDILWFKRNYSKSDSFHTVIVHPSNKLAPDANIEDNVRVMTEELLIELKEKAQDLHSKLNAGTLITVQEISSFLDLNQITINGIYNKSLKWVK